MGRYETFCPITGEKTVSRTSTASSEAPQHYFSPRATKEEIERWEKLAKIIGIPETDWPLRHPHQR